MIMSHKCGLEPRDKITDLVENIVLKNMEAFQKHVLLENIQKYI